MKHSILSLQSFDQSLFVQSTLLVPLIAQHQHRDAGQLLLVQQRMQLISGRLHLLQVGGVHHITGIGVYFLLAWEDRNGIY